jgi:2-amino-4-hydroxy-6-hydroxymethyldihydropteridine diphosphokinase
MSEKAYIGFGANLGDKESKFDEALEALNTLPCTKVTGHSRMYETEPEGLSDGGPKFLNAAIAIETDLAPDELMSAIREIELRLGKSPNHRSDISRLVDLDLLMYGDRQVRAGSLEIPHPRMHHRAFVLAPLAEIASRTVHPVLGCTVEELLNRLPAGEIEKKARPLADTSNGSGGT